MRMRDGTPRRVRTAVISGCLLLLGATVAWLGGRGGDANQAITTSHNDVTAADSPATSLPIYPPTTGLERPAGVASSATSTTLDVPSGQTLPPPSERPASAPPLPPNAPSPGGPEYTGTEPPYELYRLRSSGVSRSSTGVAPYLPDAARREILRIQAQLNGSATVLPDMIPTVLTDSAVGVIYVYPDGQVIVHWSDETSGLGLTFNTGPLSHKVLGSLAYAAGSCSTAGQEVLQLEPQGTHACYWLMSSDVSAVSQLTWSQGTSVFQLINDPHRLTREQLLAIAGTVGAAIQ